MNDSEIKIVTWISSFVFYITGELVLKIITLGKHEILFGDRNKIDPTAHHTSTLLGGVVWIGTGLIIYKIKKYL
jgi:hypothetical protein